MIARAERPENNLNLPEGSEAAWSNNSGGLNHALQVP